jgi:hypothetical protein
MKPQHRCPLCLQAINKQQFVEIATRLGIDIKELDRTVYPSGYVDRPAAVRAARNRLPIAHVLPLTKQQRRKAGL